MLFRAAELLFRHEYIITNYSSNASAETVFRTYCKRGTMENFIKEAKNGFYFDKTDKLFLFRKPCPHDGKPVGL
jgi:hypothetical protein